MLVRFIDKKKIRTILNTDAVVNLYRKFLENKELEYVIVINNNNQPQGLIYRDTIEKTQEINNIENCITKRMVTVDIEKTVDEIDALIFSLVKENIGEVVALNSAGG